MDNDIKHIAIIGGGISGLTLLHYLQQKYGQRQDVQVRLYEKNSSCGGTIRTEKKGGRLFEVGPNGFLDSKKRTLDLVEELNLMNALIRAKPEAKTRYISKGCKLYPMVMDPWSFTKSGLLSIKGKWRVLQESKVPKGPSDQESVFAFGERRFGKEFAHYFLEPMVSGIFAGDAHNISLKEAFPRLMNMEQEHGSILKAMKASQEQGKEGEGGFLPKGRLTSFQNGLSELIEALCQRYRNQIQLNTEIQALSFTLDRLVIHTAKGHQVVEEAYLCTPAYFAANIVRTLDSDMSNYLRDINYAPIAVVGIAAKKSSFKNFPEGFGYLVPAKERNRIMGVIFESNIFPNRCPDDEVLLRVMLGGIHNPEIIDLRDDEIIHLAEDECRKTLSQDMEVSESFLVKYSQGIPQYDMSYVRTKKALEKSLSQWKQVHLAANYYRGIALNDCVENAYQVSQRSSV